MNGVFNTVIILSESKMIYSKCVLYYLDVVFLYDFILKLIVKIS